MSHWIKEFMGSSIEGGELADGTPSLKIDGNDVDLLREHDTFMSPQAFGVFDTLEELSESVVIIQQGQKAAEPTVIVRRDAASLDPNARIRFVTALLKMYDEGVYQHYASIHRNSRKPGHGGPAFLPWHRTLLLDFERDLREADQQLGNDGRIALPYWDWTKPNLDPAGNSLIWSDTFLGGNGTVSDGPFKAWGLDRAFGPGPSPGDNGVSSARQKMQYQSDQGFRKALEGEPHGGAHVWVGGSAGPLPTTANDPIFWLLHCNVDRLWAEWQNKKRQIWLAKNLELPYPDEQLVIDYYWDKSTTERTWNKPAQPTGHNVDDMMWPWNGQQVGTAVSLEPWSIPGREEDRRPIHVLNHAANGFIYDTEIGWQRVKDILDGAINAWRQREGRKPYLGLHGRRFAYDTKEKLLNAWMDDQVPYQLIDPRFIGGQGSQTNLVIALRDEGGVNGFGQMPQDGPYLPSHEIEEIRLWIDEGCPD